MRIVDIHCRTSLILGGSLTIDMDISQKIHSKLTLLQKSYVGREAIFSLLYKK